MTSAGGVAVLEAEFEALKKRIADLAAEHEDLKLRNASVGENLMPGLCPLL
jgi:hypothetical protein